MIHDVKLYQLIEINITQSNISAFPRPEKIHLITKFNNRCHSFSLGYSKLLISLKKKKNFSEFIFHDYSDRIRKKKLLIT